MSLVEQLDRAHQMGCSDPTDPDRHTMYGDAAAEIRRLYRIVQRIEALADWFDASENWRQWAVGNSIRGTLVDPVPREKSVPVRQEAVAPTGVGDG